LLFYNAIFKLKSEVFCLIDISDTKVETFARHPSLLLEDFLVCHSLRREYFSKCSLFVKLLVQNLDLLDYSVYSFLISRVNHAE